MSQAQFTFGATLPGATAAADIKAGLDAIISCHSGATEPSYKVAGTLWWDTSTSLLKKWTGAAWKAVLIAGNAAIVNADVAADAILRANLGESVLCDDSVAGSYAGTGTGDRSLINATWASDARYLRLVYDGWHFQQHVSGRALIKLADSTIIGGYQSITYNGTNPTAAALSGAISTPHTIGADYAGAYFKLSAFNTGTRNIQVVLVGAASGVCGFCTMEAIR